MFNVDNLIQSGGLLLVSFIVFAESGLLIGFFLPGDTLLFGAGLAASQGRIPIVWLVISVILAAVIGDNVGYSIGRRTGPRIFKKKESLLFKPEHIKKAEAFYDTHGGETIILARFLPIIRTFAPMVAGMGKMSRTRFMAFNVVGGAIWGGGISLLGYYFGHKIPQLDKYIELVILGVVALSIGLALLHIFRERDNRQLFAKKVRRLFRTIFLK